jgi:hypothetical protein
LITKFNKWKKLQLRVADNMLGFQTYSRGQANTEDCSIQYDNTTVTNQTKEISCYTCWNLAENKIKFTFWRKYVAF